MLKTSNPPEPSFWIKRKGEISLIAAGSGLVLSTLLISQVPAHFLPLLLILQTGFEAGTVGGAADWLAVKMIFDEIKIGRFRIVPASGIIPRKQRAIAQAAGRLVAEEWLSPQSVKDLLKSVDTAGALADYLEKLRLNGELAEYVNRLTVHTIAFLEKPETQERLTTLLDDRIARIEWSQWIGHTMTEDRLKNVMDRLIPFLSEKLAEMLSTREAFDLIVEKLSEEKGGFLKQLFFDPVETAEKAVLKGIQFLRELQNNPYHPVRVRMDIKAAAWIEDLRLNSSVAQAFDQTVRELISEMDSGLIAKNVIGKAVEFLKTHSGEKEGFIHKNVYAWADDIILGLRRNDAWKEFVNGKFNEVIGEVINRNHHLIGSMVEQNLSRLSPEQIKEQFRDRTYDDMQWIRVNGAVAGFAIGILIGILRVYVF